jgi:hypothetical protein
MAEVWHLLVHIGVIGCYAIYHKAYLRRRRDIKARCAYQGHNVELLDDEVTSSAAVGLSVTSTGILFSQ